MSAWMLHHRFQQEITQRNIRNESTTTISSTLLDLPVESLEVVPDFPSENKKSKPPKSKRASSGTVNAPVNNDSITTDVGVGKKAANALKKPPSKLERKSSLDSIPPSTLSSSNGKKTKAVINLKERYLWCLSELKAHHLMEDGVVGVQTCWPFVLAVDPIQYPTYPQVSHLFFLNYCCLDYSRPDGSECGGKENKRRKISTTFESSEGHTTHSGQRVYV
jgi:hypothetical protein